MYVLGGKTMKNGTVLHVASGIAASAPLLSIVTIVVIVLGGIRSSHVPLVSIFFVIATGSMLAYTAALAYFLSVIHKLPDFDSADRARWTWVILLWFPFGAIMFWYRYIRPRIG
jgi:hypothetical protein